MPCRSRSALSAAPNAMSARCEFASRILLTCPPELYVSPAAASGASAYLLGVSESLVGGVAVVVDVRVRVVWLSPLVQAVACRAKASERERQALAEVEQRI